MEDNDVLITIDLDDKDFKAKLSQSKEGMSSLSVHGKSAFSSMGASVVELNSALELLNKGLEVVKELFKEMIIDSVKESMEAEKSLMNMNLALSNAGYYSKETSSGMKEFAESLSKVSSFSTDSIVQLESMAINMTKTEGAAKKVTQAAVELAAATGKDVNSSMQLLSLSMEGIVSKGLDKMIPGMRNLTESQLRAGAAADLIIQKFGGSGQALLQTFSGRVTTLQKAYKELHESIGNIITQSPIVNRAIEGVTIVIEKAQKMIEDWAKGGGFNNLLKSLLSISDALITYFVRPLEMAYNVGKALFDSFVVGTNVIIQAFVNLGGVIVQSTIEPLQFVLEKAADLMGIFSDELSKKIKTGLQNTLGDVAKYTQAAIESTAEVTEESAKKAKESWENMFDTSISDKLATSLTSIQKFFDGAKAPLNGVKEDVKGVEQEFMTLKRSIDFVSSGIGLAIEDLNKNAGKNFESLGKTIVKSFGNAVATSFASFGKALAQGKDAAQAFADQFISVIGSMLVQLGEGYILQGIAASANPLTPGVGGPLIAAGVALSTFGGLLSGLGGGGGASGGGGATSSSASGPASVPASPISSPQQTAEPVQQKQAQIIINGDFLNSRETANHLSEILRQNSDITDYTITAQGRNYA